MKSLIFGGNSRDGLTTGLDYEDADSYETGDAVLSGEVRRLEIQWLDGCVEIVEGDGVSLAERGTVICRKTCGCAGGWRTAR